jgi:hypothetical protein
MRRVLTFVVLFLVIVGVLVPASPVQAAKATSTSTDALVTLSNGDVLTVSLTATSGQSGIKGIAHALTVSAGVTMRSVVYSGTLKAMEKVTIANSASTQKVYSLSTLVTGAGAIELKDSLQLNKRTPALAYGFANYPVVINIQ